MMRKVGIQVATALATLMATMSAFAAEASRYDFSGAVPFALKRGVNHIDHFDFKGQPAEIIYAWRDNMTTHSYGIYSVLMLQPEMTDDGTPGPTGEWALLTFETHENGRKDGSELDALYDSPYDGELPIASVRFLKAQWRGHTATLAITARRDHLISFSDSGLVHFSIYQLIANEEGIPGWPYHYFDRVAQFTSDDQYCNSDLALTKVLHLPLPEDYHGPNMDDGCIENVGPNQ